MAIYNQGNAGGGGVYPVIIVTAPAGTAVTCSKGAKTLTAPEVDGTWTFKPNDYGVWTITGVSDGNTKTETVDVQEVTIYNVTISFVSTTLNDNDWATIKSVSDAGTGANYWSVGDCKEVTLNGKVGSLTLTNYTKYAFIIGFNHNVDLEGNNRIHFQFGMTLIGNKGLALCGNWYGSAVSDSNEFIMYSSYNNPSGGWASCLLREKCEQFKDILQSELKDVLKTVVKYTNNVGNKDDFRASDVTATTETVFVLARKEVDGANLPTLYEAEKQEQYSYYLYGNSKIKYRATDSSLTASWWTRTYAEGQTGFIMVNTSGEMEIGLSKYSYGFAPAFCV